MYIKFLSAVLLLIAIQIQVTFSQEISHTFKIVGQVKMPPMANLPGERMVEYDPNSANHLFITNFNSDGRINSRMQFLFKGKRFDLKKITSYFSAKELLSDGTQIFYLEDGSIGNEDIEKEGKRTKRTNFYPDGKKKFMFEGDENNLNGAYQLWYPDGQTSYSGNYKNNLKDGEFLQFDQSGALLKKGIYQEGELISGEAVVQDGLCYKPDVPAQYIDSTEGFDGYLKRRSGEIESLKDLNKEKKIYLNLIVDKTGAITRIEPRMALTQSEMDILEAVFKELPVFSPATVEGIPVESLLKLGLNLSEEGIKTITTERTIDRISGAFIDADEMPEFPGGIESLKNFLATHLVYPREAQMQIIEGKVLVAFIISEDGSITNVNVVRGNNNFLNAEAERVVRSMPKWIPGRVRGKPVKVSFIIPIDFILQ